MTKQNAEKISEFLTFLEFFRAMPVFSWEIEEDETYPDGFGLLIHVHDPQYVHDVLDLISGISGVTYFCWHVCSSEDCALDVVIY